MISLNESCIILALRFEKQTRRVSDNKSVIEREKSSFDSHIGKESWHQKLQISFI